MKIIRLSRIAHSDQFLHQTPHSAGRYGDYQFATNDLSVRPGFVVARHALFKH